MEANQNIYKSRSSPDLGHAEEVLRLRTQAALTWEKEARVLRRFGLTEEMSVVEFGCGSGYTTEMIAALVTEGSVTAIDIDPLMVKHTQWYMEGKSTGRVTIREGSIMDTGLPDSKYDFAMARFLLQHVADPLGAAKEVLRILKPGGRFVISDSDDDFFYIADPPFAAYQRVLEVFRHSKTSRTGHTVNRRATFLPLLKRAGFIHLDVEAVLAHSENADMEDFLTALVPGHLIDAASGANLLTPRQAEEAARSIESFFRSDETFFALIMFMACGEKPDIC